MECGALKRGLLLYLNIDTSNSKHKTRYIDTSSSVCLDRPGVVPQSCRTGAWHVFSRWSSALKSTRESGHQTREGKLRSEQEATPIWNMVRTCHEA